MAAVFNKAGFKDRAIDTRHPEPADPTQYEAGQPCLAACLAFAPVRNGKAGLVPICGCEPRQDILVNFGLCTPKIGLVATEGTDKFPKGRIVDSQWAALDPAQMGLGPVYAATPLLKRQRLALDDVDAWEINEAFAAQVIACLRAWQDDGFCRDELGLPGALGAIDAGKLNVDGGAIALGHPVGASGARIVLHLLNVLERTGGRRGLAAICIGGGQGGAMLVERT